MKRLLSFSVAVCLVGLLAAELAAQRPNPNPTFRFVTTAAPNPVQPGQILRISAAFQVDPRNPSLPDLASRECTFLIGFIYAPLRTRNPWVLPPIPIGQAKFKKDKRGGLVATMELPIPRIQLPPNFSLTFYVQGVASVRGRGRTVTMLPAYAATVILGQHRR